MTGSNQKLLLYKFPSVFSVMVCVVITQSLPWVLGQGCSSRNPSQSCHIELAIPSLLHSVPVLATTVISVFGCASVLLPGSEHTCGGSMSRLVLHPQDLFYCQWKCAQGREKGKEGGRENWKQPNSAITTGYGNLCSEMLKHMLKAN